MENIRYIKSQEGTFEVNRTLSRDFIKTLKTQMGINIGYYLQISAKGILLFSLSAEFLAGNDRIASYDVLCAYAAPTDIINVSDDKIKVSDWFNNCTEEVVGYFRGSFSVLSKSTPADGINLFNLSLEKLKSHVKITRIKEKASA